MQARRREPNHELLVHAPGDEQRASSRNIDMP
jgi:hypothetical protein